MRLVSINIFSAYFGDSEKMKIRTKLLREDSNFIFKEYCSFVKCCNNDSFKSLNIECNENVREIVISRNFPDGYPVISIPFNFALYQELSDDEKNVFWIENIEKVFDYVMPMMNCDSTKITEYINYLYKKYKH